MLDHGPPALLFVAPSPSFRAASSAVVLALLLAACAPAPSLRQPAGQPAVASSAPPDVMPAPPGTETVRISPVPSPAPEEVRVVSPGGDVNGYAQRPEARVLATQIAGETGLDPDWTWRAISQARYRETVARLMMPPPAGTPKNWAAYRSRFVEPIRIRAGVAFWRQHEAALQRAQSLYGVPAEVIAGVLGVETIYGRQTGQFRVLDVLTTLSLDFPKGRSDRSAYFRSELSEFLKLCQEQGLQPEAVLGSYAGAIGWPQFMPGSIRRHAVDFDGDGRIDLQRSPVDAIGSVANYLARHGWQSGWASHFEVRAPENREALDKLLAPDIVPSFSPQEMQSLGATLPQAAQSHPGSLALVLLQNGAAAPTLIAGTQNFYAITRYNQSSYYALAVIQLGEAVQREVLRPGK